MKKLLSALTASVIAIGSVVPVLAEDSFKDVTAANNYSWAYEYVENMADKGLVSGYEDGTYRPGKSVSRMEAFAFFARLMGSSYEQNAGAVEAAKEVYADILNPYKLTYAEGDVAFMLSRGVITEEELDTYFAGEKKNQPMPRYEAAILITKAMLAEDTAKEEVLFDLGYKDGADIPANAKNYVYYVSEKGIMSGMGDDTFSPTTAVQRGQMAVMLSKTCDSMNYTFEEMTIAGVDIQKRNIKIRDSEGRTDEIGYNVNTRFIMDGEEIKDTDLVSGQSAVLTYTESDAGVQLAFADITTAEVDSTVKAVYRGYASQGGKLTVTGYDAATDETTVYDCSPAVTVLYNGALTDINKIPGGTYVTLGLAGDTVMTIASMNKKEEISGLTLESISPEGAITVSSEDEETNGKTYLLGVGVEIIKNGNKTDFVSLYRGDTLNITLEYGVVSKIVAISQTSTVSGTLKSYTISSKPSLTIKKGDEEVTYDVPSDIVITLNGEASKLAEFEIGMNVTLKIESDVVKEISASAGTNQTASSLTGVVTGVNPAAKVLIITYDDGGEKVQAYITCTTSTNYYVIPTLSQYSLKSIKQGDTVVAYGSYANGVFVASGVTVTPAPAVQ